MLFNDHLKLLHYMNRKRNKKAQFVDHFIATFINENIYLSLFFPSVDSDGVDIVKGFRYDMMVYHKSDCVGKDFARVGVVFPDLTEVKPINKTYLQRSMGK